MPAVPYDNGVGVPIKCLLAEFVKALAGAFNMIDCEILANLRLKL